MQMLKNTTRKGQGLLPKRQEPQVASLYDSLHTARRQQHHVGREWSGQHGNQADVLQAPVGARACRSQHTRAWAQHAYRVQRQWECLIRSPQEGGGERTPRGENTSRRRSRCEQSKPSGSSCPNEDDEGDEGRLGRFAPCSYSSRLVALLSPAAA